MNDFRRFVACFGALAAFAAAPAAAIIRVDMPVSKTYGASATVIVGKVAKADDKTVIVDVTEAVKGAFDAKQFAVDVSAVGDVGKAASAGQPVVVFVGRMKGAAIHLADTWLSAGPIAGGKWTVTQKMDAANYPGRTAALVCLVADLKAGKNTMLNGVEHKVFGGGPKELGALGVSKPAFLLAGDINADKTVEIIVGAADGVKAFAVSDSGVKDITADVGLSGAKADCGALGDVNGDGKPDLLLGKMIYTNDGKKFALAKSTCDTKATRLAVAIADATGDGKADVVSLTAAGELTVFENPGNVDGPWKAQAPKTLWKEEVTKPFAAFFGHDWGDNGKLHVLVVAESGLMRYSVDGSAPPANYGRLTGHAKYMRKEDQAGLKPLAAFPLDIDGNGQMDLVVLTQSGGGFELCNRGFGCFLVNPDVPGAFFSRGRSRVPFTLKNTTRIVGADLHGDKFDDAVVLAEDGKLCEISNTPYPPHP